jgi:hypothetical protein
MFEPQIHSALQRFHLKSFLAHSSGMVLITSYLIVNSYINMSAGAYIRSIKNGELA